MVARPRQKAVMTTQSFIGLQKVCKPIACRLGLWRVVTSPVADAHILAVGYAHLDFAEFAVGGHICWLVGHQVLLAQFPFELLEGLIQSLYAFGDEGASAGRLTKLLQSLPVNPVFIRVTDPYGVDNDLGAQRFFDRLSPVGKARGVVTIGEQDDRLSPYFLGQQVCTGRNYRVEDGCSSSGRAGNDRGRVTARPRRRRVTDDIRKAAALLSSIVGEVLYECRFVAELDYRRRILVCAHYGI